MKKFFQTLRIYFDSYLIKLILFHKKDLGWIFVASSIMNLLMLTPMLYMLQIFDRVFISKRIYIVDTIRNHRILLCYFCSQWLYSF